MGGRVWRWCFLFIIASLLTTGCKTWSYTAKHRGIRTIVYNPTNVPIDNIDLDSPFFASKAAFATNEQPAFVIAGMIGWFRIGVIDLKTGNRVAEKRVWLNLSSVTIQPLEIEKSGKYKACLDLPDEERRTFRFSVDRTSPGTNSISTNSLIIDPLELNPVRLRLNTRKVYKNYDALFIASIQQSWYDLVKITYPSKLRGVVIINFRLNADGSVTNLRVEKNTAGDVGARLCQEAITKAGLQPWPEALRKEFTNDYRDVQFTFHY